MTFSFPFKDKDSIVDSAKDAPFVLLRRGSYSRELIQLVTVLLTKDQKNRPSFSQLIQMEIIQSKISPEELKLANICIKNPPADLTSKEKDVTFDQFEDPVDESKVA
jgi:hypothetical protein